MKWLLIASFALTSGCYASSPSGGGSSYSTGGCKKGCRCGNSCIDCSKQCHGGETYRKRKRR